MQAKSFFDHQRIALKSTTVSIRRLTPEDKARMLQLMQEYYEAVTERRFLSDLSKKDAVILLKDRESRIQGFSTLATVRVKLDGKTLRAVFSGDTVIDKQVPACFIYPIRSKGVQNSVCLSPT